MRRAQSDTLFAISSWSFLQLLVVIFISSPGENDWDMRLCLLHDRGYVTHCEPDSRLLTRVWLRAVDQIDVMKRHVARVQNYVYRYVRVQNAGNCVAPTQNVFLLWFFPMSKSVRVSGRQYTEAAIGDSAFCQRDPRGNQAGF